MPIAYAIIGLTVALVAGHIGPGGSNAQLLDMAVVTILILQFVIISLYRQGQPSRPNPHRSRLVRPAFGSRKITRGGDGRVASRPVHR